MNQLSCNSCGSALEVDGFDRRLAVVHCSHCGVMYDLTKPRNTANVSEAEVAGDAAIAGTGIKLTADGQHIAESDNGVSMHEVSSRAVASMPEGFSVSGEGQQLVVSWSWLSASSIVLLGFACFWNVMIFLFLSSGGFKLLPVIFMVVGLGLLYRGIAGVVNETTISADDKWLKVRYWPLPWFPAPTIDSSSIEQLFVSEGFTKDKDGEETPYYILNAVLRDNSLKQLSNRLPSIEPALFLEQEFERTLRIRDRPVAGEVRGDTRHV